MAQFEGLLAEYVRVCDAEDHMTTMFFVLAFLFVAFVFYATIKAKEAHNGFLGVCDQRDWNAKVARQAIDERDAALAELAMLKENRP